MYNQGLTQKYVPGWHDYPPPPTHLVYASVYIIQKFSIIVKIINFFRMIVWALSSLERRGLAESALTLENLMSRLKLRYDREIDRAERSVLRKITEKDEPSSR